MCLVLHSVSGCCSLLVDMFSCPGFTRQICWVNALLELAGDEVIISSLG